MDNKFLKPSLLSVACGLMICAGSAYPDQTWTKTYNTEGLLATIDGPRNDVTDTTTYSYDANGNLASVTNALGQVIQYSDFNSHNLPGKIIDQNGVETELIYHVRGWLLSSTVKDPGGDQSLDVTTGYQYDLAGQLTQIDLPNGVFLSFEYDDARRLTAVESPSGERIEYTHDAAGNRIAQLNKASSGSIERTLSSVYDELSRLTSTLGATHTEATYQHDANGNVLSVTDGKGNSTTQTFDERNRRTSITDASQQETLTAYDGLNRIAQVIDPRGVDTSYSHDVFGNLTALNSGDTGSSIFSYDEAGNRTSATDARNVTVNYVYDTLNRPLQVSYPASPQENVTYQYDDVSNGNYGIGRLTSFADESGSTSLRYNHLGHMIQRIVNIGSASYLWNYSYDKNGRITSLTYPSGRQVRYERDPSGRVTSVHTTSSEAEAQEQLIASNFQYLAFGGVKSFMLGNGIQQTLIHDQDYRVTGIHAQGDQGVLSLSYNHDLASNITAIDDAEGTANDKVFVYDSVNRLVEADKGTLKSTFGYDGVGNRTQKVEFDGGAEQFTETLNYDVQSNRLESRIDTDAQFQSVYQYDAAGNVVTDAYRGINNTYNDAGRLATSSTTGSQATYVHNSMGQRATKIVTEGQNTSEEHYVYNKEGALVLEADEQGTAKFEYIYADGLLLAVVDVQTPSTAGPMEEMIANDMSSVEDQTKWSYDDSWGGFRIIDKGNWGSATSSVDLQNNVGGNSTKVLFTGDMSKVVKVEAKISGQYDDPSGSLGRIRLYVEYQDGTADVVFKYDDLHASSSNGATFFVKPSDIYSFKRFTEWETPVSYEIPESKKGQVKAIWLNGSGYSYYPISRAGIKDIKVTYE
jgi:YD repeat-containing protein